MFKKFLLLFLAIFVGIGAFASEINTEFFNNFNDEYLTQYITEALKNNNDLKIADQRVEQYRQQVKISFSRELPSLSVGANYLGLHLPDVAKFDYNKNGFVMPFVASYEADILLKNHDKTKSAKKNLDAAVEEKRGIYIALLGDVASNYINILQYDYLIKNQEKVVKLAQEQSNRTQAKFKQGLVDTKILNSVEQNFNNEKNSLITLKKQQEIILNNFAVLIGQSSDGAKDLKRGHFEDFEYQKEIPTTVKSDVIFSRPDVIASEKQLEGAKIDIRVARKEFLPTFNITGLWAFNTLAEGSFFSWESSLATLMIGATQDIFKGGQKVANLRMKKAKYEELFENYRKVDLNAVKEVNTALCLIKRDSEIDKNTQNQLDLENKKFNSTNKLYSQGLIAYPEKLTAETVLLTNEQNKAKAKTQRLVDYITLYKAVGGAL